MALLGRSYTNVIIAKNFDDGTRADATPGATVFEAPPFPRRQAVVLMSTGPGTTSSVGGLVVSAWPPLPKTYVQFTVHNPTDTPVTTTTAESVVVTSPIFPPKVKVWTWKGDPNAAPPPLGDGPPVHCLPSRVGGTTRTTGVAGTTRTTGVAGIARVSGVAGLAQVSGSAGNMRVTGGRDTSEYSTGTGGAGRETTAEDFC